MKSGYILGINGWLHRSHDASACIVKDGHVLAMAEEERFTRKKHAYDKVPTHAIMWCLDHLKLTLDDIQEAAVGWNYKKLYSQTKLKEPMLNSLEEVYFPKKYFKYSKKPKITLVSHHLAHAVSSYYLSGYDKSSILIIDGQGEDSSTTFAVGSGAGIKILWSLPISSSLGYFYEAVSDYIGLGVDAAGKTMGLASYGNPKSLSFHQFKLTDTGFEVELNFPKNTESLDQQQSIVSTWEKAFEEMTGKKRNKVNFKFRSLQGDVGRKLTLGKEQENFAASAQYTLEMLIEHCVKVLIKKTSSGNLCLGGGVALNCSTNTKLYNLSEVENIYIPPFANDAGVAVGAALYVGGIKENGQLESAYTGPSYDNSDIEPLLQKLKLKFKHYKNIEEVTAKLIHKGKIVSWFQGQMEVGPRALGNRSILANPTNQDTHKKVNEAKNRELWRPLAPSILDKKGSQYMEDYFYSPFMLHTFQVKESIKRKIPAIVHVDGSTRPQSVRKEVNPRYYKLISCFEKLSGVPIILDTSFNGAKEPIVCTPMDAIGSFFTNSTDCLVLGNYLIEK